MFDIHKWADAFLAGPKREMTPACGIRLSKGHPFNQVLVVTTAIGTSEYLIDRWD